MKKKQKLIVLIAALLLQGGCTYYKTQTRIQPDMADISQASADGKNFLIHAGNRVYGLYNVTVEADTLSGQLGPELADYDFLQKKPKGGVLNKHGKLLEEVHLFVMNLSATDIVPDMKVKIPYSAIYIMDTYQKDHSKTATVTSAVMITATAALVTIVIVGIIRNIRVDIDIPHTASSSNSSSCPFVYVLHDTSWRLAGEIFGGAVFRPLERDDYMLLPGEGLSNGYSIKVRNELSEIQYINQLEIMQVQHPEGSSVIPACDGTLHSIRNLTLPERAVSASGADVLPLLRSKDRNCFFFNEAPEVTGDTNAFNSVILSCSVPAGVDTARLVVHGGNQMWADYQINEMTSNFGRRFDTWTKMQNNSNGSESLQWNSDQKIYLEAYVEEGKEWKYAGHFELTGPEGRRDLVMPLEVSNGSSKMNVKLLTGFMFWQLDYAAFDFSLQPPLTVISVKPVSALTGSGKELALALQEADNQYYIQHDKGEEVVVNYEIPSFSEENITSTLILHSRGYYEQVRNYTGSADMNKLLSFREKGKLSRESYRKFSECTNSIANLKK